MTDGCRLALGARCRARRQPRSPRSRRAHSLRSPQPPAPASVFRAGADVVSVEASVRRDRRAVIGLTAADFEILDNGVPQQITDVSYEKLPIDVTVLLDVSASVTGSALDDLRRALKQLRSDLGGSDRLRLLTFNMRVRQAGGLHRSRRPPPTRRSRRSAAPAAAPCSTASPSRSQRRSPPGRRQLIVLFSDGQDSSSITDADTLLDVARRSTPTVAVVLPGPSGSGRRRCCGRRRSDGLHSVGDLADQIAGETGGFVAAIAPGENLTSTFRRVLEQFRASYVLYFTPNGVDGEGPPHARRPRQARRHRSPRPPRLRLPLNEPADHERLRATTEASAGGASAPPWAVPRGGG